MKHATTEALLQRTRGKRLLLCSIALLAGGTLHAIKASAQETGEIGAATGTTGVELYVSEDAVQGLYRWEASMPRISSRPEMWTTSAMCTHDGLRGTF